MRWRERRRAGRRFCEMKHKRFTLEPRRWYAMLWVVRGGGQLASPIWVMEVRGLETGKGVLEVKFWHANYPEGVQDKTYVLRVVAREQGYLLGRRLQWGSKRANGDAILLAEVTPEWVETHFRRRAEGDMQAWLDKVCGRPRMA
jgi:hypothetical protein